MAPTASQTPARPQVIIVGAGPTGACLALMLVQRGISVKLIESARTLVRSYRGEALMPSGLEALVSMGLSDLIATLPHRALSHWEFWIEDQIVFTVPEPIAPGELPCTLVAQTPFLEAVIEQAKQFKQFELIHGETVQDLCWEDERVVGVRSQQGNEYRGDLVIGADGRNSIVRRRAELPFERQNENFDILWFKLPAGDLFPDRNPFCTIVKSGKAFGLFRSADGQLQIGWSSQSRDANWKSIDWIHQLSDASPPWLRTHLQAHSEQLSQPIPLSVSVGRCTQWYKSGVLVLGDAAHPMSPIRAQGINMGLRDVLVATNYLVKALKHQSKQLDPALLQIQAERLPEIIRVQAIQAAESGDAEKLRRMPSLGTLISRSPQPIRQLIKLQWQRRQRQLRSGFTKFKLNP